MINVNKLIEYMMAVKVIRETSGIESTDTENIVDILEKDGANVNKLLLVGLDEVLMKINVCAKYINIVTDDCLLDAEYIHRKIKDPELEAFKIKEFVRKECNSSDEEIELAWKLILRRTKMDELDLIDSLSDIIDILSKKYSKLDYKMLNSINTMMYWNEINSIETEIKLSVYLSAGRSRNSRKSVDTELIDIMIDMGYNIPGMAKTLGINKSTLYRKLREIGKYDFMVRDYLKTCKK